MQETKSLVYGENIAKDFIEGTDTLSANVEKNQKDKTEKNSFVAKTNNKKLVKEEEEEEEKNDVENNDDNDSKNIMTRSN